METSLYGDGSSLAKEKSTEETIVILMETNVVATYFVSAFFSISSSSVSLLTFSTSPNLACVCLALSIALSLFLDLSLSLYLSLFMEQAMFGELPLLLLLLPLLLPLLLLLRLLAAAAFLSQVSSVCPRAPSLLHSRNRHVGDRHADR